MVKDKIEERDMSIFDTESNTNSKEYKDLLALYEQYPVRVAIEGEIVTGVYQGKFSNQHVFSVNGLKDDVRVDDKPSEVKFISNIEVGDATDIMITKINNKEFLINGSVAAIYIAGATQFLNEMGKNDFVLAYVKNTNPAGYDLNIILNGVEIPAFMPNTLAGVNKLHDNESIVGQTFEVGVESFAENEGTWIVSRKRYLKSLIPNAIKDLEIGAVYTGHVTDTTPFGIFVEFNECLTTMIHKSNVREDWQDRISDIKPGFEIQFYLKELVETKRNTKIIATQILKESLWDVIEVNNIYEGTFKGEISGGVLVELDDETIGMINESDMNGIQFETDEKVIVYVSKLDKKNKKIYLKPYIEQ